MSTVKMKQSEPNEIEHRIDDDENITLEPLTTRQRARLSVILAQEGVAELAYHPDIEWVEVIDGTDLPSTKMIQRVVFACGHTQDCGKRTDDGAILNLFVDDLCQFCYSDIQHGRDIPDKANVERHFGRWFEIQVERLAPRVLTALHKEVDADVDGIPAATQRMIRCSHAGEREDQPTKKGQ